MTQKAGTPNAPLIVATAGHVDHGKTALVRALTGIDTDRLPQEKERGLTIDLGFAYQQRPGGVLGFIDVPGHERFVRTMIAGVACIDHALIVVAADDGPMPQTIEHIAVLDLLGVARGTVALSKADKVGPERLEEVEAEIAELLAPTALAHAPVLAVSAVTGQGIEPLTARLDHILASAGERTFRDVARPFRLCVDRVFTLSGVGVVVTGAVFAGQVRTGERVVVTPVGVGARVRAIHAQGEPAEIGRAGERCAVNLVGPEVDLGKIRRGSWVVAEGAHAPTSRVDARVRVLASEPHPLRDRTPVHLHHGAEDVPGRIAILEGKAIAPGESGLAQLVLERQIACAHGERFVLRDQSARRTIGGGGIIDPFAPARGRATAERLSALGALENKDAAALTRLLEATPFGVDLKVFALARNLGREALDTMVRSGGVVVVEEGAHRIGFSPGHWAALRESSFEALQSLSAPGQDPRGITVAALAHAMGRLPQALVGAVLEDLVAGGRVEMRGGRIRPAGSTPALEREDRELWEDVRRELAAHHLRPPSVSVLAEAVSRDARRLERLLSRAAELGMVCRIARNRFILPEALDALGEIAEALASKSLDGTFDAAEFRDKAGIGRNVSIEVAEYFDRVRFTRRVGERRRIVTPLAEVEWRRNP